VFGALEGRNTNKWNSETLNIDWRTEEIESLIESKIKELARRRKISQEIEEMNFNNLFLSVFEDRQTSSYAKRQGRIRGNYLDTLGYITGRTRVIPRDIVAYLSFICKEVVRRNLQCQKISFGFVLGTEKVYSDWLHNEIVDEMVMADSGAKVFINLLGGLNEVNIYKFKFKDVVNHFYDKFHLLKLEESSYWRANYSEGGVIEERKEKNAQFLRWVLQVMYHYNLIGNRINAQPVFRGQIIGRGTSIDLSKEMSVHRGLHAKILKKTSSEIQ
jgi:hypothetical protein